MKDPVISLFLFKLASENQKPLHNLWIFSKNCLFPLSFRLRFWYIRQLRGFRTPGPYKCIFHNFSIFWAKFSQKIRVNFQKFSKNCKILFKILAKIECFKIVIFDWGFLKFLKHFPASPRIPYAATPYKPLWWTSIPPPRKIPEGATGRNSSSRI